MKECFANMLDASVSSKTRFWMDEGVYYAEVPLLGLSFPVKITLHGLKSDTEAEQALEYLKPIGFNAAHALAS